MRVIRIGRDVSNDYVIHHPAVSGNHADIYVYDNGAMQLVEHSTNGTYVNNAFVHNGTYFLYGNEILCFPDQCPIHISKLLACDVKVDTDKPEDLPIVNSKDDTGSEDVKKNTTDTNQSPGNTADCYTTYPGMSFGATLGHYFQHYADFNGRARRQEYWYICLWNLIFGIIPLINILWMVATLIPSLAVAVRRLHDTGKSGFALLLSLVPVVGSIVLLVWYFTDSEPRTNKYGASPKYVSN